MTELDAFFQESFEFYKGLGIAISLLLIVAFQLLFPNRLALRRLLRNWRVNLPIALINTLLLSLLCGACLCTWAILVREQGIGFFELVRFPVWLELIATVLLLDWVAWIWHRANHRFSILWRFHAVHHSDQEFDASTAFRFHPGEVLIALGIRLAAITVTALPIAGLIAFEVLFGFFNLFVHSDIRIHTGAERWLGALFVTPSLHRLHHSSRPDQLNANFGTIFSCWDRLTGTYSYANARTAITVGLPDQSETVGVRQALGRPFARLKHREPWRRPPEAG